MEHTHLVKGLDYALLQKVRSEIHTCELEQEQQLEQLASGADKEKEKREKEEVNIFFILLNLLNNFALILNLNTYKNICMYL